MQVGYHGLYYIESKVVDDEKFLKEQTTFAKLFKGGMASVVRLHGWTATKTELENVVEVGKIHTLLCPEKMGDICYMLNREERQMIMEKGSITLGSVLTKKG